MELSFIGIQFILPVQGFYCNLCKEFVNDSYQAQKHFKSAKHNRSYTVKFNLNYLIFIMIIYHAVFLILAKNGTIEVIYHNKLGRLLKMVHLDYFRQ